MTREEHLENRRAAAIAGATLMAGSRMLPQGATIQDYQAVLDALRDDSLAWIEREDATNAP